MKQITEDEFASIISANKGDKVLITSPTCDVCHNYVDTHTIGEYVEIEGGNDLVSETLGKLGVSSVPVFYQFGRVWEPEDLERD